MPDLGAYLNDSVIENRHCKAGMALERTKLAERALYRKRVPISDFRVWDDLASLPPATSAADDLALVTGAPGTNPPLIQTSDLKTVTATRIIGVVIQLDPQYQDGGNIKVVIDAGMQTTVADTSATVDLEAYQLIGDGTVSSDLCATAAQDINSLTYAEKQFTLTPTGLVAGDAIYLKISIAVVDGASVTAVIGSIREVLVLQDIYG